jgi:hypothetical protein
MTVGGEAVLGLGELQGEAFRADGYYGMERRGEK